MSVLAEVVLHLVKHERNYILCRKRAVSAGPSGPCRIATQLPSDWPAGAASVGHSSAPKCRITPEIR